MMVMVELHSDSPMLKPILEIGKSFRSSLSIRKSKGFLFSLGMDWGMDWGVHSYWMHPGRIP